MPKLRLVLAALALTFATAAARGQDEVRILVPAFSGERQLGLATSNLLRLQVSQTFQVAGTPTRAVMLFDDEPLRARSHEAARDAGTRFGTMAHLVLWGQSYEYPDGVVIRAHLSTTPLLYRGRPRRPELWAIDIPGRRPIGIRAELPRSLYEFPAMIVPIDAARHYRNVDALVIYRNRDFTQPIGRFRDEFSASVYEADRVLLESGGVRGWVRLPHLIEQRTEIVEFVGGYLRLLRGDWPGAQELLRSVLRRETITSEMRIDSHIFLGLIEEKRGRSGLDHFRRAQALNEYDFGAASYLLMGHVAQAMRPGADRRQAVAALREQLAANAALFAPDDRWIATVRRAADALESGIR